MKRVVVPELLDTDAGTPQEVVDSLKDLAWLNRNFGGVSTTTELLRRVAERSGSTQVSFLDVAGGRGDVANGAREQLRKAGVALDVTVLDRAKSHLGNSSGSIVGDAFQLPFRDDSFDVVGSTLFVHHLEPVQIASFVNESLRVCRQACVINDLKRGYFHLLMARAGRVFYRSKITAHDSAASVRRAYTRDELSELLRGSNAEAADFSDHFLCRMGVIAWKKQHD